MSKKAAQRGLSLLATASSPTPALLGQLPAPVAHYVQKWVDICQPKQVEICDGSPEETRRLMQMMQSQNIVKPLRKMDNCWIARTDPKDVARVESKTFISTDNERETRAPHKKGVNPILGNWMSPEHMNAELTDRFPGSMQGRTMYVLPFSMGPIGGPLSKLGVELTDSPYVAASMNIMTRMGSDALEALMGDPDFVGCLHSVGRPLMPGQSDVPWPCDPARTMISHLPDQNEICSFGSGYGGNSLLGKKCLALRLGSILARKEGWLAEHMVIMGITNPQGKKRYIAAAFPSACGKTNLAMLTPTLPGYKIDCVGDDIAWMRFDSEGRLRAINPENGFFGVAPGTSTATNAIAMEGVRSDTVFTNTAETADGGVYWEGLENEVPHDQGIIDWKGQPWQPGSGTPAAHPNSRFCSPLTNCSILDPSWDSSEGVPIDAIIFGGRRPEGVPLVYESFSWTHGVMMGAAMRSEATAAAEFKGKAIMHDPFAMRPFFGYNFGDYLRHWNQLPRNHPGSHVPKIFQVNWFRKGDDGKFLWPGFGENIRVLDWILRRIEGEENAADYSPIGWVPRQGTINLDGLKGGDNLDWEELMSVKRQFWSEEMKAVDQFLDDNLGIDYPEQIANQVRQQQRRIDNWDH